MAAIVLSACNRRRVVSIPFKNILDLSLQIQPVPEKPNGIHPYRPASCRSLSVSQVGTRAWAIGVGG